MATEEELRAEQWQRDQLAREAFQLAQDAKLHGDPAARRELEIAWRPLEQWLLERGASYPDDTDCGGGYVR